MKYETNAQFRGAVGKKLGREIPITLWESFAFMAFRHKIASHEPFDDEDLKEAVPRMKKFLELQDKTELLRDNMGLELDWDDIK